MGDGPEQEKRLKLVLSTDLGKITNEEKRKEVDKVVSIMEDKGISLQRQIDFVWLMWKFSLVGKKPLLERKAEEVMKFLNSLALAPRTYNLYHSLFLYRYGKDFMAKVPKRNGAKATYSNDELLTREEMYKVVESALTHQHRALLGILADSAARKQELRDIPQAGYRCQQHGGDERHSDHCQIAGRGQGEDQRGSYLRGCTLYQSLYQFFAIQIPGGWQAVRCG